MIEHKSKGFIALQRSFKGGKYIFPGIISAQNNHISVSNMWFMYMKQEIHSAAYYML